MKQNRLRLLASVALAAALLTGCSGGDPAKERRRWNVSLQSMAVDSGSGKLILSVRVDGPPNAKIDRFTFQSVVRAEDKSALRTEWHTIDLADIPRGGPKDMVYRVENADGAVGVTVDPVHYPTDEELPHIVELAGS